MSDEYHISSAVVLCKPDKIQQLITQISDFSGVEVHGFNPEGKIVVSIESDKRHNIVSTLEDIAKLDAVLSSNLVFHQFESASEEVS
ncbi:chaperone NapD [Agarivorans gilvus]|jgi:nitrate reductase NapD|uniref:Chaperone NapD n=1 Tax=Agarivorans gilvus TaxID=680279 RepID=A0ABQ1HWQ9_9ALTE|nr:chaperone NapD [Agarivorans gilvus]GGA95203.1 sorbose reductase [Agarivorans gilvus]